MSESATTVLNVMMNTEDNPGSGWQREELPLFPYQSPVNTGWPKEEDPGIERFAGNFHRVIE
jgi:hypothetical protein